MSERKLATIRRIAKLEPIPGADRIEVASIDGWKVVTQKNIHKEGDLVVYFEIDSLLPERAEFEFLRDSSWVADSQEGPGFRLRTIKLRKQVSQGLIIPIRELSEFYALDNIPGKFWYQPLDKDRYYYPDMVLDDGTMDFSLGEVVEDLDVTELLGVKKYERIISANLAGKIRGNFPSFIPKTDQERIQNSIKSFLKYHRDHDWEVSLKLDGSSMTAYYKADEDRFGVCSRNLDLKPSEENAFWQVATSLDLENKMRSLAQDYFHAFGEPLSLAIQGELIGPGIQGNREGLQELKLFVYDIFDIEEQTYFNSFDRIEFTKELGIDHVPVYSIEKFAYDKAGDFLELAEHGYGDGKSLNNPVREGLVFKSIQDPNVSFKAISNKFLLDGGD